MHWWVSQKVIFSKIDGKYAMFVVDVNEIFIAIAQINHIVFKIDFEKPLILVLLRNICTPLE